MRLWGFSYMILIAFIIGLTDAMSRQQLKNTGKMLKKNCLGKIDVTEDQIADIEKGKFIDDKNVKCYIACIYQLLQLVKNGKLNYDASIKQVDAMYPPDIKDAVKSTIDACKDKAKNSDICEASYATAKCMYEKNPKVFVFP